MYPILFKVGGITVYAFGTMLAIAFIVGLVLSRYEMKERGFDPDLAYDLVLGVALGSLIGARLFYVIGHWSDYYSHNLLEILRVWNGGLVFYGGLLGGAIGMILIARVRQLNIYRLGDAIAAPLALGTAIGRIGCFLNGCCYGIAAKAPWGLDFFGKGRYLPTQLIEMVWALVMFGIIFFWLEKKVKFKTDGSLFLIYLALYSFGRFFVEFIRYNSWRLFGVLSFAQLISIVVFVVSVYFIIRKLQKDQL
jgi:phosphatidylglycerol---prolipoprotein diacylglyceryl transferase